MGLEQDYLQLLHEHGLRSQDMISPAEIYSKLPGSTPLAESLLPFTSQNDVSDDLQHPFEGAAKLVRKVADKRLAHALNSIYFNVFPTEEYNAICAATANGYLCLINNGIDALATIISASLALCTVEVDGQPSLVKLDYLIRSVEGRIAVNSIFDILVKCVTCKKLVPSSELLSLPQEPFQWNIMACLELSLKAFVVSHECSHVVLNHFDSSRIQHATTPSGDIEVRNPDFAAEFAADQEAIRILLRIAHVMGYDSGISFSVGGSMFLAIAILIEIVDGRINRAENKRMLYGDTHPAAQVRLMRINEYTRGALPRSAISLPIGLLLGELIDLAFTAKFVETDHGIMVEVHLKAPDFFAEI
ncbi:MAG: hypothetical protein KAY65_04520 [Planctomycetes bacterium]|nr:hypothetical protein [Planctomycetota bacterium]